MKPLVSVCVVTYNHEKYIRDCILSVLQQSFDGELELIIGEDCSTDSTAAILDELSLEFPNRLLIIHREINSGPYNNLRDIAARARGDFIAHMDGDDYWMPGKLQAQLHHFALHPDCIAVYANAHVIDGSGALKGAFNNAQPATFDTSYLLRGGNFLNHSSLIYRRVGREAVVELSGSFIDYRIHLRLSASGKLGYVNRDLIAYRVDTATSMMSNMSAKVQSLYWEALADKCLGDFRAADRVRAVAQGIAQSWMTSIRRGRLSTSLSDAKRLGAMHDLATAQVLCVAVGSFLRLLTRRFRLRIARLIYRNALIVYYER